MMGFEWKRDGLDVERELRLRLAEENVALKEALRKIHDYKEAQAALDWRAKRYGWKQWGVYTDSRLVENHD